MRRVHVCSKRGCPELVPCPKHSRPRNAPWSDRDKAAHDRWQRAVKQRDGYRCIRCGKTTELVAHHVKPGFDVSAGITLCRTHHKEIDQHAR